MKRFSFAVLALVVLFAGCRSTPRQDASSRLVVFAAASLTESFGEIADSLRARHPGLDIQFNFASTSVLALQLTQGAAADVFASADLDWMKAMEDSGIAESPYAVFAHNTPVVVVPAANPAHINSLTDLARKGVKLVLAGASVPAGRYARTVIRNLGGAPGFPAGFERSVLANVASNEESVKGVVTKVALGEADAGIVYLSDVVADTGAKLRRIDIPPDRNVVAVYPIASLKRAANPAGAREFIDLVRSAPGQGIMIRHGFSSPPN